MNREALQIRRETGSREIAEAIWAAENSIARAIRDAALMTAAIADKTMSMRLGADVGDDVLTASANATSSLVAERRRVANEVHARAADIGRSMGVTTSWGDGSDKQGKMQIASDHPNVVPIAA